MKRPAHSEEPPPPPPAPESFSRTFNRRPRGFACAAAFGGRCSCCAPDGSEPWLRTESLRTETLYRPMELRASTCAWDGLPFVDTHCHLEELLHEVRKRQVAPCLMKPPFELSRQERAHFRTLGWLTDGLEEEQKDHWSVQWSELSPEKRRSAEALGYTADAWNRNQWLLPRGKAWEDLDPDMRQHLQILGESKNTWEGWAPTAGPAPGGKFAASSAAFSEIRVWSALSKEQQAAAIGLGFTERIWNNEEVADLQQAVDELFGSGFEGIVTQGCDEHSFKGAQELALSHPQIYVSFGCHPKAAWFYDDDLEAKMLECMKASGKKMVAWGEFGLDYSHPQFGPDASNRRKQREVFARQLKLAIARNLPLVIHSREAEFDTIRMMRHYVPGSWKVHMHSYRGSMSFMRELLAEWPGTYIGMPGILTMDDEHAQELVRQCPIDRMLLETDAPYLPVQGHWLSHSGLIKEMTVKAAELKGMPVEQVAAVLRENARNVYGI